MKRLYWRPNKVSQNSYIALTIAALAAYMLSLHPQLQPASAEVAKEDVMALALAKTATEVVRAEKLRLGKKIDESVDPRGSGLIGLAASPITTDRGQLDAKQISTNPNFALVVLEQFRAIKLKPGDTIAVSMSGSFPALNIATYAAAQALGLKVVSISTAGASTWGANDPDFLWLDMEKLLHTRQIFNYRAFATSLGGVNDVAAGMSNEGRAALQAGIVRSGLPNLNNDPNDSFTRRAALFAEKAGKAKIKAYVNVGGGIMSTGGYKSKISFEPGLNTERNLKANAQSLMAHFNSKQVPVIHLSNVKKLAQKNKDILATGLVPQKINKYEQVKYASLALAMFLELFFIALLCIRTPFVEVAVRRLAGKSAAQEKPEFMV